ncbi:hypothetical protein MY8738_005945 [Beauveria namnaoensis]
MTDVDMDVDAYQQRSLEVPMDDDLINYESDAGEYSLAAEQDLGQDLGDGAVPEASADARANAEPTLQSSHETTNVVSQSQTMDQTVKISDFASGEDADEQNHTEQAAETDLPLEADAAEAALDALTENVADEIDYSLGEVVYTAEPIENTREEVFAEDVPDATEITAVGVLEDKAEISWEDEVADNALDEVAKEGNDAEEQHLLQTHVIQLADPSEQAIVEADETESRDHRQDELQTLENASTWHTMDSIGDFQIENKDLQFPSITVQYQGDEFPFLASGSEGFFSDSSILDASMQNVFRGFRSQLKHEVKPEDELVLQIDELGLEFTESNPFSLTMRQILEVFELLIKNEDPDGRRTLYTYLFTRLNSARRYNFLVESATSGKGLGEIQHIFSQQSLRDNSDVDPADDSAVSSEHPEEWSEEEYGHEHSDAHGEIDDHHDDHHDDHEYQDVHHGEYQDVHYDEHQDEHQDEYHDRRHEEDTAEDAGEPGEEYQEEPADDDHGGIEYFDEAFPQASEPLHGDSSAIANADSAEKPEADEHDDNFAHEHSSTTSTLQGDAEGTALADDETAVDAEADGPVFVAEANEDAEIDWRDDESELVGDGGSVTGKRSRDDNDEPDVDDEIDFKRRRP